MSGWERETVWLRQDQMSQLLRRERSVVTKHARNVFREGELDPKSACANFAHAAADGKTYSATVGLILGLSPRGETIEAILADYPGLTRADIAVSLAASSS